MLRLSMVSFEFHQRDKNEIADLSHGVKIVCFNAVNA